MIRILVMLTWTSLFATTGYAEVKGQKVTYKDGNQECHGYLAWDDSVKGPRPGVLVVHEWWGLDDYARKRADQLAQLGYVAFAADMYGEGKRPEHPKEAGEMAGQVRANTEAWRRRAKAALDTLKAQPQCDPKRLAAIGYCFGGATVLQLAYSGEDLRAVVSFHGALPAATEAEAKKIKAEILVCHGADDSFIPPEAIKAFREVLDKNMARYEFVSYPARSIASRFPMSKSAA